MTTYTRRRVHSPFVALYVRLVNGLGIVWIGGWIALLLDSDGHGLVALIVLLSSAILAGERAGTGASGIVLLEATLLIALAVRIPLLAYVWADLGPLTLLAVLALQLPVAFTATLIAERHQPAA